MAIVRRVVRKFPTGISFTGVEYGKESGRMGEQPPVVLPYPVPRLGARDDKGHFVLDTVLAFLGLLPVLQSRIDIWETDGGISNFRTMSP